MRVRVRHRRLHRRQSHESACGALTHGSLRRPGAASAARLCQGVQQTCASAMAHGAWAEGESCDVQSEGEGEKRERTRVRAGPRTLVVGVSTPPEPACGVVPHSGASDIYKAPPPLEAWGAVMSLRSLRNIPETKRSGSTGMKPAQGDMDRGQGDGARRWLARAGKGAHARRAGVCQH